MKKKSSLSYLIAATALFLSADAFGLSATVRSKAELLDAVAKASDGNGLLLQDLDVVFAADCAPIEIGEADVWNKDAKCLLDCGGRRITLDAGDCPSGTVVIGASAEEARMEDRSAAVKGCGKGSVFRNLTLVNQGRIEFASAEGTRVKDCDFVGCGSSDGAWADDGGAVRGCGIVEGCGFERCRARRGGALSDCGYAVECLFVDCRALDGGGAVAGPSDVSRCEFRNCGSELSGGGAGGAIYGGRDVVSCLFVDCTAKQGGAIMSAGPLDGLHSKIVHCTFIRCRGEQSDEAVFDNSADSSLFMLNCLSYGSAMLQEGADEDDKFGCYCLADEVFFADYAKGDFHPNQALPDDWADPCGLMFGESGAAVFVCRDLDGYGYQLSSPWPVCPGCYRFRAGDGEESASSESAGKGPSSVVKPRRGAKPGHWRVPPKRAPAPAGEFWNSVRNSPPHVVSQWTTSALLDLSKLPCEIARNEIVHGGDDYLDFVSAWYERSGDLLRFFDLCGPLKMPEVGVTPGYGCPGLISPYEEDDELKALAGKYRFRTGWFRRGFPKEGDSQYQLYQSRLKCWESRTNDVLDCSTCTVEKIPFLFSPAPGRGPMPLVVYIAGSGEQGTDLKKMFRQTGVFDAVRDPSFVFAHPCHLLAIMPPEFASWDSLVKYPHRFSFCSNPPDGCPPGSLDLVRMYTDLVFELQRNLVEKGRGTIDPNAIVLAGLTQDVDTIRGDLDKPDGFLYRNTEHIYDTFVWLQNNYMTKHQPKNIRLIPLYEVTDEAYTVEFADGSSFVLPKPLPFTLKVQLPASSVIAKGKTLELPYTITGVAADDTVELGVIGVTDGIEVKITATTNASGTIDVTNKSAKNGEISVVIYATNHIGLSDICSLSFTAEGSSEPEDPGQDENSGYSAFLGDWTSNAGTLNFVAYPNQENACESKQDRSEDSEHAGAGTAGVGKLSAGDVAYDNSDRILNNPDCFCPVPGNRVSFRIQ